LPASGRHGASINKIARAVSALVEFDDACRRHDAETETIRQAFLAKWGKVPLLETYRQMAIRQQKLKNWNAVVWWTERGLALYDNDAASEDAVEDLLKRRNRALAKLQAAAKPNQRTTSHTKSRPHWPKAHTLRSPPPPVSPPRLRY
jgi:hypothetical protein